MFLYLVTPRTVFSASTFGTLFLRLCLGFQRGQKIAGCGVKRTLKDITVKIKRARGVQKTLITGEYVERTVATLEGYRRWSVRLGHLDSIGGVFWTSRVASARHSGGGGVPPCSFSPPATKCVSSPLAQWMVSFAFFGAGPSLIFRALHALTLHVGLKYTGLAGTIFPHPQEHVTMNPGGMENKITSVLPDTRSRRPQV
jgi:hypothetical protein